MRAILISIKPERVEKILNGKKTIEIRKTAPKFDLPIDVYVYCTLPSGGFYRAGGMRHSTDELFRVPFSNEFKYGDSCMLMNYEAGDYDSNNFLSGKVVAKFTLSKVIEHCLHPDHTPCMEKNAELSYGDLEEYAGYKKLVYAWHIDNLKIFDEPMELSRFTYCDLKPKKWCGICGKQAINVSRTKNRDGEWVFCEKAICGNYVKRPPQSWQYVEEN